MVGMGTGGVTTSDAETATSARALPNPERRKHKVAGIIIFVMASALLSNRRAGALVACGRPNAGTTRDRKPAWCRALATAVTTMADGLCRMPVKG
jgi:hypothetical protein